MNNKIMNRCMFLVVFVCLGEGTWAINCPNPGQENTTITTPAASADKDDNTEGWNSTKFRWDFQGLKTGVDGAYVLTLAGSVTTPGTIDKWELESKAGTLQNDTATGPTHVAPAVKGDGWLQLNGSGDNGCDKKKVKIYKDWLEMDKDNFGTSQSCADGTWKTPYGNVEITRRWNCHGSAQHLYDGSGIGTFVDIDFCSSWNKTQYDYPFSASAILALNNMSRGDIVSFYSDTGMHAHTHTSLGGADCYGANNEFSSVPEPDDQTWVWQTCTSVDYANGANQFWGPKSGVWFTEDGGAHIIIHKKP